MKNIFKKTLVVASIFSILISATPRVNAIDSSTSYNGTSTITVTSSGKDFSSDNVSTFRVTTSTGSTVSGIDASDVTNADGSFTVDVSNDEANVLNAGGIFTASFITNNGGIGSSIFVTGNANKVSITANVLPILTMSLSGTSISFGDLVADSVVTASPSTVISINTNAANGYVIQVSNSGLVNASGASIPAASTNESLTGSGYGYGINASVSSGQSVDGASSATGSVYANFTGTSNTNVSGMSSSSSNLSASDGPVSSQNTTVRYHARVSALQQSGNYTDTVTYSVTGSF